MKEILIISPFSLQGTYVEKNLQKKDQNVHEDVKNVKESFLTNNFFNEKKLDQLYQLRNELSKVNCLYFVITKQILHKDFNDYFINLIMAIHHARPEYIIIDTTICKHIYSSECKEIIQMITSVFKENQLPVIQLKKDSNTNKKTLHFSCSSTSSIDEKIIFKVHKYAKKIFFIKNQIMNPTDLLVPIATQPNKKTFDWHNHSYNLN
ncbi:hypothetical protein [Aquimarina agarilytica]|uniref:hypothetical protein n=1 Tax=Aquimarina agarilytica TaxID=1087449 RepID=UPI0002890C18|nr:hypothetical protein [Aquimarina agarilytica]